METVITLRIFFINEMNRRKNSTSTTHIQQGISKFVEKSKAVSATSTSENTGNRTSTTSSTSNLKRMHQGSHSPSTEKPPNKRQATRQGKQKTMEANNNPDSKQSGVDLNPELHELKRQLFEGFEQMIEPLKQDIEDLKTDRDNRNAALNVETLSRKLKNNDEKHRKLESRLSQIEDQLLERNLIFEGIVETEFEDRNNIKIQLIKAIAPTMDGEDEEEQKKMKETLQLKQ